MMIMRVILYSFIFVFKDGNANSDSVIAIVIAGIALLIALLGVLLLMYYVWRIRRSALRPTEPKQAQLSHQAAPQLQLMPYEGADNQGYFTNSPDRVIT